MKRHLACAVLLLALGCRKPMPSPEYTEASGLYSSLIDSKGDEAYSDPEMDRVYALCTAVSGKSSDYAAAQELLKKIDDGRARLAKAGAAPGTPGTPQMPELRPIPTPTQEPGTAAAAEPEGLAVGADWVKLQAKHGVCFTPKGNVAVTGEGAGNADGYEWAGRADCDRDFPGMADKLVLVRGGKVLMVVEKQKLQVESYLQLPDGGRTLLDGGPMPEAPAK